MSVKTAGVGHFQIPTAPAAGTSVASGAANVYTTTPVQLIASTAAALYITGLYAEEAAVSAATYKSVQLMIGAAASETVIGQYLIAPSTGSTVTRTYRPIFPPIPVANGIRISVKTADSVGALATLISLEVIAQTNVADDGITVGTVNLVNTATTVTNQLTAAAIATGVWQDATAGDFTTASSIGKCLFISNVAPGAAGGHFIAGTNAATTITTGLTTTFTGNLTGSVASVVGAVGSVTGAVGSVTGAVASVTARVTANTDQLAGQTVTAAAGVTFPTSVASPTNITAGTIATVTTLTNLPSIPANWLTAAGISAAALNGKGDWMVSYTQPTGFLSATFPTGTVANTTNITAGTITTATNLTNAPSAGDFTATMKTSIGTAVAASAVASVTAAVSVTGDLSATMKTSVTTAATAATPIAASVSGNVVGSVGSVVGAVGSVTGNVGGNVTGNVGSVVGAVGSVTGLTASNLDATVSSRLATGGYTAPDNTSIAAIKSKTDSLNFSVAGQVDANIKSVADVTVTGIGTTADPWGQA